MFLKSVKNVEIFGYLCAVNKKNMRLLTLLLLIIPSIAVCKQQASLESMLREIDREIGRSAMYVARHENHITDARRQYAHASQTSVKYGYALQLYELYKPFVSDSAIYFLREAIKMADQLGDRSESVRCRALMALRCTNVGMYDEALLTLDSIQTEGISQEALGEYYKARNNVYNELAYYTQLDNMRQHYWEEAGRYEALMYKTLPPTDMDCMMRRELAKMNSGELAESMKINDEWLKSVEKGSHPYALVTLYRYLEYKAQGDSLRMMQWLTESVLADIRNGVMDQGSMWELANQLYVRGDIDRAYRYISYTSDCAGRYGSRQRRWQITPLLTEIANNYKAKSERTTSQLWVTLGAISVLALLLMGVLFFLRRRNRQLALARNALHDTNDKLASLNEELQQSNSQLSEANERFSVLNSKLKEANSVKDEYIGRFLSLCSQYVDKLDNYRKMVNKKMKNKELDELFRISKSTELKEQEIEELNQNFDSVFLHLFPNFIDDFNALLVPEAQIHPKEENRLTTDLRIFALIRLGIEDSSKIAEFLHYSVNTVYNYRARIKNGAVGNREAFERQVKELGMPR